MSDRLNADSELEELASFHDKVLRLREQLKWIKDKQSDVSREGSPISESEGADYR